MGFFGRACLFLRSGLVVIYVGLCVVALITSRGLFGLAENTDAVIALIYMGLPWSLALAALPGDGLELALQVFVVAAPIINLWLLSRICRSRRRRRRRRPN